MNMHSQTTQPTWQCASIAAHPLDLDCYGLRLHVPANTFLPTNLSTQIVAQCIPDDLRGYSVLDVGAGTGVHGLLAAKRGAKKVTLIDISRECIHAALQNADVNGVRSRVHGIVADANNIDCIRGQYDLIIANLPIRPKPLAEMLQHQAAEAIIRNLVDPQHRCLTSLLKESMRLLSTPASVLFSLASFSDERTMLETARLSGFQYRRIMSATRDSADYWVVELRKEPALSRFDCHKVNTRHHPRREILKDVSITLHRGEVVSVIGPSACGKTTLLRSLAGLLDPDQGLEVEATIHGNKQESTTGKRSRSLSFAFVFQDPVLLPWRTVRQNVTLPAEVGRQRSSSGELERLLYETGVEPFVDQMPHELSGGERQRASLARALLCSPDCLLLDEPFGALDSLAREELNALLRSAVARHNMSAVLVTHSLEEAVFLGDEIVLLGGVPTTIIVRSNVRLHSGIRDRDVFGSKAYLMEVDRFRRLWRESRDDD